MDSDHQSLPWGALIERSTLFTNPFILSLFLGLLAGTLTLFSLSSYDIWIWWILAVGEIMLETGEKLRSGIGSWTRVSTPYVHRGRMFAILTAFSHRLAGEWGLIFLRSSLGSISA
jgi:hypothetical protein